MMHSNISEKDWKMVKGEIQKTWSSLNASDLEQTHGDVSEICSLVQEKYGLSEEDAERRLDEVIARCGTAAGASSVSPSSSAQKSSTPSEARFDAGADEKFQKTSSRRSGQSNSDLSERSNRNVSSDLPNKPNRDEDSRH